jgi:hypothetical protein
MNYIGRTLVRIILTGENHNVGREALSVLICPPQIPYALAWDQTRI